MTGKARKWIYCPNCGQKRWATPTGQPGIYICTECSEPFSERAAKQLQTKLRKQAREAKAKTLGTYESESARKQRRLESRRKIDPRYVWWIHGFHCVAGGCNAWPVDAHHVYGRKAGTSDRQCVPLCHQHHMEFHQSLGSVHAAELKWGINLDAMIQALNKMYDSGRQAPRQWALDPFDSKRPKIAS